MIVESLVVTVTGDGINRTCAPPIRDAAAPRARRNASAKIFRVFMPPPSYVHSSGKEYPGNPAHPQLENAIPDKTMKVFAFKRRK